MVHACARKDCNVMTMGRFCLEHEQQRVRWHRPPLAQLGTAFVLVAAGIAGAAVRARFVR